MRRFLALSGLAATFLLVFMASSAAPAAAGTTAVPVSMSFGEIVGPGPFGPPQTGCPELGLAFTCGTGVVVPFGMANDEIVFGSGCGGACDFRIVDVAGGTVFLDETASNFSCPGACASQPSQRAPFVVAAPFRATLSDVVVGGTGIFDGATGTLAGSVSVAGAAAHVQLSGTITLDP
jgi:hypothetical protein